MSEHSIETSPDVYLEPPLEQADWLIDAPYPYTDAEQTLEMTVDEVPPLDDIAQQQAQQLGNLAVDPPSNAELPG